MANEVASSGQLADTINAASALAEAVGPEWGIAIIAVILLLFPKIGVVVNLAQLFKEDRADARKRKVETERLEARYKNRSNKPALPRQRPEKEEQKR